MINKLLKFIKTEEIKMQNKVDIFPEPILSFPQADIPLRGIQAYLSQGDNNQVIFMEFSERRCGTTGTCP